VFIHGIWGTGKDTWLHSSGNYWPSLVLKDDALPGFDVYVFEYPSPARGSAISPPDIATVMKQYMGDVFDSHKQIIVVAHSMGGLLLRGFLLRYRDFAPKTAGAFFLGTPTTGSIQANRVIAPVRTLQLEGLTTIDVNLWLQNQQSDWIEAKFKIASHCAFEVKETVALRIVTRESAATMCTSAPVAINEDHIGIVKLANHAALQHITLRNMIKESLSAHALEQLERLRARSQQVWDNYSDRTRLRAKLGRELQDQAESVAVELREVGDQPNLPLKDRIKRFDRLSLMYFVVAEAGISLGAQEREAYAKARAAATAAVEAAMGSLALVENTPPPRPPDFQQWLDSRDVLSVALDRLAEALAQEYFFSRRPETLKEMGVVLDKLGCVYILQWKKGTDEPFRRIGGHAAMRKCG
jgi:pimeloyl-ACP methyl ester carboxylesterase